MGILSDNIELALLKHMFGQTELSIPSGLYLGLHTGSPLEDSSVSNEISTSGTGYARIQIANDASRPFQASSSTSTWAYCDVFSKANTTYINGVLPYLKWDTVNSFDTSTENLTNHHAIDFAESQSSWGNISHWSIWNSASGSSSSNLVATGALSASVSVGTGDVFRIPAGDFDITWPSKIGRGATTSGSLDRVDNFSSSSTDFKDEKLRATEWRLQLMRRLGFETMPTNWDSTTYASSPNTINYHKEINHAWPNMSLPYLGDSYSHYNPSTTTTWSSDVTDQDIYLALYKSDPGNHPSIIATSVEPNTSYGYNRVKVNSKWATASISGGVASITNNSSIAFDEATTSWGTITHWGLYRGDDTSSTNGYVSNPLWWETVNSTSQKGKANCPFLTGALTTSRTVNSGDVLRFGTGDFVIKLD